MTSRRSLGIVLGSTILFMLTPMPLAAQSQLWVGPNVNMVSGTTWPDGDPFLQRQNEPSIAVSTRKTTHLMGFTNDYRSVDIPGLPEGKETGDSWLGVFKSFDGGLSWRSTLLPGYPQDANSTSPIHGYDAAADPVVRAGTNGLFYLSGIVFDRGDTARSGVFVSRYMDLDNKEHGDPIEYVDTTMVSRNEIGDFFIDKPWMAVDIPRPGAQWAQLEIVQDGIPIAQNIPCGNVYLAWAEIWGVPPLRRSRIMFSSSVDCGANWSAPLELSAPDTLNQGVSLAVSPTTGDVWVAWRQFETDPTYLSCAFGGGYWKNRPEEWPLEFIEMGGVTYSRADAIAILDSSTHGDATYILAQQLIPAKLNMAYAMAGGEMIDLIIAADAWLVDNPLGSKPRGQIKEDGLFIKDQLEAYNEGLLVAEGCTTSVVNPGTGNAILAMRLSNAGIVLGGPTMVAHIAPLEQGTSPISFRTNAYPTITVDNADPDRAYVAWTTRGEASPRGDSIEGDARIVVATSTDGLSWAPSSPVAADNPVLPGHQLKPSITFAGGKVLLTYLDLRLDRSALFERFIADWPSLESYRHTVDVRVAVADPADQPVFTDYSLTNPPYPEPAVPIQPSDQVSRYVFIPYPADPQIPNPDEVELIQFQYNPPNLPIFVGGTRPFFGDYIDIAPSPPFLPDGQGGWRFNSESEDGAVFHVTWTDNRDVEAPHDGDWSNYVPPQSPFSGGPSLFDPSQIVPDCNATPGGEGQTRIRDQNTYTARVSRGLHVASPGSARTADDLQRAFVIFVQNDTQQDRAFRLSVSAAPGVNASFEQFASRAELEVEIPGFSSASRTVFVSSDQELPTVQVSVVEIDGLGGWIVTDGLTSTILLNPDPSSPPSADPGIDLAEVYTPAMMNPAMMNLAMMNPAMMNLAMMNLAMMNPAMMNPAMMNLAMMNPAMMNLAMMNLAMMNPAMMNPAMMNLAVYTLAMMNPAMMNPAMMNLAMMNPAMMNLAMMNPAMMNASLTDLTWEVRNEGNTTASYSVNLLMKDAPEGFIYELLVYRLYTTPVADGCELIEEAQQQMLVHIIDPDLLSGALLEPGTTDPDLGNATFWVEPGDQVYVTLRVVDPDASDDKVFDPTQLSVATVAQAVNTEDVQAGSTQPSYSIPDISVPTPLTMDDGRTQHTATLLEDGTVLITGGFNPSYALASAEIYDPVNKEFDPTGSMSTPRSFHTSTRLEDGRVLVVGMPASGYSGPSAELYDPATGSFTPTTGDLAAARHSHQATRLHDGRVLITGGTPNGVTVYDSAEIFDPATGEFTTLAAAMTDPRAEHTATLLGTGEVLITGGTGGGNTGELFDPTSQTFTAVPGTMSSERRFHSATLLPDGTVLLAGGYPEASLTAVASADVYDRASNSFIPAGSMHRARSAHTASLMPDGKVLLAGGGTMTATSFELLSHIEMYDWSTGSFTEKGDLTIARTEHAATRLPDGTLLITGGSSYGPPLINGTDSAELYLPSQRAKFLEVGRLGMARTYHQAVLLEDGSVLVIGGTNETLDDPADDGLATSSVERFDPTTGSFSPAASMNEPRMLHSATTLLDGRVLVVGGTANLGWSTAVSSTEVYDAQADSFSPSGSLNQARTIHRATLLGDGKVLITGGREGSTLLNTAEVQDPASGTFNLTASTMVHPRFVHTATLLADGRVLLAGGEPDMATAEVYDPATNSFTPTTGIMNSGRFGHAATLLGDGRVLVSGGGDPTTPWKDSAEIFDPATGTFTLTLGTLHLPRRSHQSVLLPDGSVLITGGYTVGNIPVSAAERFNPGTGTFELTDVGTGARAMHTATPLSDGHVLLVGGWEFYGASILLHAPSRSAETFDPWIGLTAWGKTTFVTAPPDVPIGGIVPTPIMVSVEDDSGVPLPGYTVTIQVSGHPGGATTHNNIQITNSSGIASFPSLWFDRIGNGYRLAATVTKDGTVVTPALSPPFDVTPLVVTNTNDSGPGSLRQCLENAERNAGWLDSVSFEIPLPGMNTIVSLSPLPKITDPIELLGPSQPGYSGEPLIRVDFSPLPLGSPGFSIEGTSNVTIRGLMITGSPGAGVLANGNSSTLLEANFIGTDGFAALGNEYGVVINGGAGHSLKNNVVAGNARSGISIESSDFNSLTGNKIGTNTTLSEGLGNGQHGVYLINGTGSQIGHPGDGNVIMFNGGLGILNFMADGTQVTGNLVSANTNIQIGLWDSRDCTVANNLVGTDESGTAGYLVGGGGVEITNFSSNNTIGGPAGRNVIAGTGGTGIYVQTLGDNLIEGNYIGVDATGNAALGNSGSGIEIAGFGAETGHITVENNLISGNGVNPQPQPGILVHDGAQGTIISGNRIGTNATGTVPLPNTGGGLSIAGIWTVDTTVSDNVISGNSFHGIDVVDQASNVTIIGNLIGTNSTGTIPVGNEHDGVRIESGAHKVTIGGTSPGTGNVIAANGVAGIIIAKGPSYPSGPHSNTIQGNWVGTNQALLPGFGNSNAGIFIDGHDNLIGGTEPGSANIIAFNGQGVAVADEPFNVGNAILSNVMFENEGLGIDLGDDGVTPNDPGDTDVGANYLLNAPILNFAEDRETNTSVGVIVELAVANGSYRLEFFANNVCNSSGHGEGQTLVYVLGLVPTDPGVVGFTWDELPPGLIGQELTATISLEEESTSTSEFSNCMTVYAAGP